LDNKALDIIDARCNHEGPGVAFSYLVSGTYSGILQPTVRWQNKVGLGTCKYTNPYFAVSQIHGGAPRIKKKSLSCPSVDGSIKIVRHLERVFLPYRKMFELKETMQQLPHNISAKRRKH